jgi:hypothetical protein
MLDAYKLLAGLGTADQPGTGERSVWNAESIALLHQQVRNVAVRTMLDLCAKRAGQWVSIREVEKAANLTQPKVRGALAGFTMMLKARFGGAHWPIEVQWTSGTAEYRMSPEIARLWIAALK